MKAIVEYRQSKCAHCGAKGFCRIQDRADDMTAVCPREVWDVEWERLELEADKKQDKYLYGKK